ncbi:MAG: type II toxin-antitoxin system RelE/ParE family toxin [Planctomycetes bacterium]|nr:type II toxin-antitoxin system RelE/ParE family toxin [Planctomycetota bacterium]
MPRVELSPAAVHDLHEIWTYIAVENHSQSAADRLLARINDVLKLLSEQPEMGVSQARHAMEMRSFVVQNYVIFYRPLADGALVIRVLHGARKYGNLFE